MKGSFLHSYLNVFLHKRVTKQKDTFRNRYQTIGSFLCSGKYLNAYGKIKNKSTYLTISSESILVFFINFELCYSNELNKCMNSDYVSNDYVINPVSCFFYLTNQNDKIDQIKT